MGCPTLLAIFWREGGPLDINEYLYLGNQRVARALNFGSSYYYYADYLGTSRASADENGNKCYDADYFPWGGEQYVFTNTCSQNYKFTGKERDPDMGIDDFGARFYKNTMARFYSPDWSATVEPVPYARLNNPQSLNLYTYVLDNPLSFRDADGHELGADTLQEVQKITSDSGNAAQSTQTDKKEGAVAYSEKTTTTKDEAKAVVSVIENRASRDDKQYVDKGKDVNVENVINHKNGFQGVGGQNYNDFVNGKATGEGAKNATDAVNEVHQNGVTTSATFLVVNPGGKAPTDSQVKNLGNVQPSDPSHVGDIYLYEPK